MRDAHSERWQVLTATFAAVTAKQGVKKGGKEVVKWAKSREKAPKPPKTKPKPTPATVRVQLQRQRETFASVVLTANPKDGVTVAETIAALQVMRQHQAIPRKQAYQRAADVALNEAIKYVRLFPPLGAVGGGATRNKSVYFNGELKEYRFDVGNIRGHNWRRQWKN